MCVIQVVSKFLISIKNLIALTATHYTRVRLSLQIHFYSLIYDGCRVDFDHDHNAQISFCLSRSCKKIAGTQRDYSAKHTENMGNTLWKKTKIIQREGCSRWMVTVSVEISFSQRYPSIRLDSTQGWII